MNVPPVIVRLLEGSVGLAGPEQVFLLVTADADGFAHVALLSRAELCADDSEVRAAIRSRRTRADLRRHGRACLIAVEGTSAHHLRLEVRRMIDGPTLGAAFAVQEHEVDSVGVPLQPLMFQATSRLGRADGWDQSAAMLAELAAPMSADPDKEDDRTCQ